MSTSAKEYDDLKIVISRVDEICNFLNKMKKSNKSTKDRIDLLESNYKELEKNEHSSSKEETYKTIEVITERLDNLESSVLKNKEIIKFTETEYKELKNSWAKETDIVKKKISAHHGELERYSLKLKFENESLKQGIHDLEEKISNLDEEYKLIKGAIESKKSRVEDTEKRVYSIEAEMNTLKKRFLTTEPRTTVINSVSLKCRVCDDVFDKRKDLSTHMKASHANNSKCRQCDKVFETSSQLETHLLDHDILKKHKCEKCGKTFHFRWRLDKHIKMHGSEIKIKKCHFFNNNKSCPFEELGCRFLHEESSKCKYSNLCKFDKCQFRH